MSEFSKKQMQKIAYLARIKLDDNELDNLSKDLTNIFYILEQLQNVDTKNITPLISVAESPMVMRDDAITDGGYEDLVTANAKNVEFNYYVVPKVVE